jgi:DNA-binding CsgD family transcriptional regulator
VSKEVTSENLIDGIYEAAAFPDRWPEVLDALGEKVGAMGAILTTRRTDHWTGYRSSPKIESGLGEFLMSPRAQESRATLRVIALDRPGFVTDTEVFTPDEWRNDALYTDWVERTGGGHATATAIQVPSGEFVVVHLHRRLGARGFERRDLDLLDSIRPHLARAGMLAARWRLERIKAAAEALALVGLPAMILDRAGRVLAANALIENMTTHLRWLPKDRIALADAAADAILRLGLASLGAPNSIAVRSFAARADGVGGPVVVHLVPTPGQARDLFDGALGVLVVTPVAAPAGPDLALIRGLFDLTPAEARVARGLTQGMTVTEIAGHHGVVRETIRSQVKAVMAKTGARHQAEVAALLGGLAKFPMVDK